MLSRREADEAGNLLQLLMLKIEKNEVQPAKEYVRIIQDWIKVHTEVEED